MRPEFNSSARSEELILNFVLCCCYSFQRGYKKEGKLQHYTKHKIYLAMNRDVRLNVR